MPSPAGVSPLIAQKHSAGQGKILWIMHGLQVMNHTHIGNPAPPGPGHAVHRNKHNIHLSAPGPPGQTQILPQNTPGLAGAVHRTDTEPLIPAADPLISSETFLIIPGDKQNIFIYPVILPEAVQQIADKRLCPAAHAHPDPKQINSDTHPAYPNIIFAASMATHSII